MTTVNNMTGNITVGTTIRSVDTTRKIDIQVPYEYTKRVRIADVYDELSEKLVTYADMKYLLSKLEDNKYNEKDDIYSFVACLRNFAGKNKVHPNDILIESVVNISSKMEELSADMVDMYYDELDKVSAICDTSILPDIDKIYKKHIGVFSSILKESKRNMDTNGTNGSEYTKELATILKFFRDNAGDSIYRILNRRCNNIIAECIEKIKNSLNEMYV